MPAFRAVMRNGALELLGDAEDFYAAAMGDDDASASLAHATRRFRDDYMAGCPAFGPVDSEVIDLAMCEAMGAMHVRPLRPMSGAIRFQDGPE